MIYLQNNVFDEALERLRMIFDGHDDVIVSMSGGKDSTVLFRMALMVAQERGRLPLKVFWLDQEAEWQATVDYMQHIMELPEVTPYWYQIPFEFTNTLSPEKNFISVWNPEDKAICSTLTLTSISNPLASPLPATILTPMLFSMMGRSVNPKRTAVPDTKPIWITLQRKKHRMLQSPRRSR